MNVATGPCFDIQCLSHLLITVGWLDRPNYKSNNCAGQPRTVYRIEIAHGCFAEHGNSRHLPLQGVESEAARRE